MNLSSKILSMRAIRLLEPGGPEALELQEVDVPLLQDGEALVRVYAAAITRDELDWPVDRLPAIPSYELSGVVEAVAADVNDVTVGEEVYALTPFDRDGVAAEYAAVPAGVLAPKPEALDHVESAAIPMAGLTAWQGLFDHGELEAGQRVLIHGAAGGVGHVAVQLARSHGAHVIGTSSGARAAGAHEAFDYATFEAVEPVDLVFDTVGGDVLARSTGPRIVSIAEEHPGAKYFVVEPNRGQLVELARLIDAGTLRPAVDKVFPLEDARAAFDRVAAPGKRGKVVLRVR
jgi:NADPH:quinone reductase-like Zn-dependent oxidoreductase